MKRLAAILLTAGILLAAVPFGAAAFGKEDNKLIITHINTSGSTEGSAIVVAGTHTQTLGTKGGFDWWRVAIFDWDANDVCFKVKEINTKTGGGMGKGTMQIPKYGFAYCICVGNDYSASGGINYVQQRIKDSYDLLGTLKVGDRAYLYNTHLAGGQIVTNGKEWYLPEFTSDSYVKIGTPDKGMDGYDPVKSEHELTQYRININHVNDLHYEVGDCNLFLSSYGKCVKKDYSWWSCLVFAWDQSKESYVCVALDTAAGGGNTKEPPIPENGFVVLDCSSASKEAVGACALGTQAYLYKDASGKYTVTLNLPDKSLKQVLPEGSVQEKTPKFSNLSYTSASTKCSTDGFTIKWEAGSPSKYLLSINLSTPNGLNKLIVGPIEVTGTSYTIPAGKLAVGNSYTVMLTSLGGKKLASVPTIAKLYCVSKTAMNSSLADKTIVAFGDSLTARSGWVSMLGGTIGTEVINSGVGGDSTKNAIARLKEDVLDKKPDIVLICFGMNDQAQSLSNKRPNVPLETYISNMEKCITEVQKLGADVILIAPHDAYNASGYYVPGNYGLDYSYGNMKDFCAAVRQMAIKYGCDFIDIYTESKSENMAKFLNAGDGIHQSVYGHQRWAAYVGNYLLAKYDGENKAKVEVVCKNESGSMFDTYSFTAAIGSKMTVPAKEFAGCDFLGKEKTLTVTGNETVVYPYSGTSAETSSDPGESSEPPTESSEEPAESSEEPTESSEEPVESSEEPTESSEAAAESSEQGVSEESSSADTSSADVSETSEPGKDGGLPVGAIVGIIAGAVVVIGGAAFFILKKKKK